MDVDYQPSLVARENTDAERAAAVRFLASRATDGSELAEFLSMAGLTAADGKLASDTVTAGQSSRNQPAAQSSTRT